MGDPISPAPEPITEAAGVEMPEHGLQGRHADDDPLLAAAMPLFDALLPPRRPPMPTETLLQQPEAPTRREAFAFWLKLGFVSFGGPAGQIALMHEELIERRRRISENRFLHALNYCMLLPGPEAQQLATYIGWLMHRTWGGIVVGGLCSPPVPSGMSVGAVYPTSSRRVQRMARQPGKSDPRSSTTRRRHPSMRCSRGRGSGE